MSNALTRDAVLKVLSTVQDTQSGQDVVSAGLVSGVVVRGGQVGFLLATTPENHAEMEPLRVACEQAVARLPGVDKVTAVLTAETAVAPQQAPRQAAVWNRTPLDGVRHIVAIASGKGGVGKSTTTVCLAHALKEKGLRVGILDADIYGPSIPLMMGLSGQPDIRNNKMVPPAQNGIACMSMGLLIGDEAAVMRAPMVTKALNQMLRAVDWGMEDAPLDVLLVDMPPGTGDIHLSMAQQAPLSGAIIVTTPQEVAVIDARKAVQMFRKVGVPVLGIVENMSYMTEPVSGNVLYPFGRGGGERLTKEMATLFLGEVPLDPDLGAAVDAGRLQNYPAVYQDIANSLWGQLSTSLRHKELY